MGFEEVLTFLIPTLNERDGIGLVIDEIKSLGFNKILVVDGNSTDGTPEIAKEKGAKVIYQQGKGKALAIMTGLKHVDTPYVAVIFIYLILSHHNNPNSSLETQGTDGVSSQ